MSKQERWTAQQYRDHVRAKNLGVTTDQLPGTPHPKGTKCKEDGHTFDSKTERDFYRALKADPTIQHIDVHPVLSLPGFRFAVDFIAYVGPARDPHVYDVKGRRPNTAFHRIWQQFNQVHPLAPLFVARRNGDGWRTHSAPPKKEDW